MTKAEIIAYQAEAEKIIRLLKKYERQIAKLKEIGFTKNRMVSKFYKNAELDVQSAVRNVEHGYKLHKHYIIEGKEKENIITSNRFFRESSS